MRHRTRLNGSVDLLSGPAFSTRQVTAIVMAILLAVVLVPMGAQAAQVVNAIITDPSGSSKANVDQTNSLTVATRPASSTAWYAQVPGVQGGGEHAVFAPPAGATTLAISTLTWTNVGTAAEGSNLHLYGSSDCVSNDLGQLELVEVRPVDTVTISFPQPLLIGPGGSNWCLTVGTSSNQVLLTATGYYY
jgi:hypothetical protein